MIESFNALGAKAGNAKSEALARGISLALVSTAFGLGIAIVSVALYYYLLNRVDMLVRDLDEQALKAIDVVSAESIRPAADRRSTGYAGRPRPARDPNPLTAAPRPRTPCSPGRTGPTSCPRST